LKFQRPAKEAKRLIRNLVANLILYEKVKTTASKAKKARRYLDRIIKIAKRRDLSAIRYLNKFFYTKEPVKKLIEDLSLKYSKRTSGFSRIIPLGARKGDAAKMVIWELVEFDKEEPTKDKTKKVLKPTQKGVAVPKTKVIIKEKPKNK